MCDKPPLTEINGHSDFTTFAGVSIIVILQPKSVEGVTILFAVFARIV